jgi:hypothetical protein
LAISRAVSSLTTPYFEMISDETSKISIFASAE